MEVKIHQLSIHSLGSIVLVCLGLMEEAQNCWDRAWHFQAGQTRKIRLWAHQELKGLASSVIQHRWLSKDSAMKAQQIRFIFSNLIKGS